jgi:hypothetical protein
MTQTTYACKLGDLRAALRICLKTIELYRDVALLRYVSSSSSISTTGLDLSGLVSKKEILDMVRVAVELYRDTGLPAGFNALPTMVPRAEQNNVVLTQDKAVRKHARTVARKAQGLHTTKGLQSDRNVVDFTDAKVRSVNHYHYIKPEANIDASTHLKRKQQAIKEVMDDLDPVEDYVELQELKMQKLEVSKAILKELTKFDDKILC